jgi:sugar phosphate isomerase/epimerase
VNADLRREGERRKSLSGRHPVLRSSSITFQSMQLELVSQCTAALGFGAMEVWIGHLAACKTPELLRQYAEYSSSKLGLKICAVNGIHGDFRPFDGKEGFDTTLRNIKQVVDTAEALSVRDVFVYEGIRPKGMDESRDPELLKTLTQLFKEAIAYSAPKGIGFLTEPHPFTLGMDMNFLIKLCDSLDPRFFGVLYDCCHFGVGKPTDYVEPIRILDKRIRHIHFSDSDQKSSELHFPPGKGKLDLEAIVSAYKEIGYKGTITLDLYGYPMPEYGSRLGITKLTEVMNELGLV